MKIGIDVHRAVRNSDDGNDVAIIDVEDQMRALAIAAIAFADLGSETSGTRILAQPVESFCQVGKVFFRLTFAPRCEREVCDVVEIL